MRILFVCLLSAFLRPVAAQVQFTAQASTKDMGKGDYVQVQFIVENAKQIDKMQTPDLSEFNIVEGPSQSTGMSVINGAMSEYKGISFLLQPKKSRYDHHQGSYRVG